MNYADLTHLLGEAAAALLVERLGGIPVYVPACPSSGSPLVLALGHAAAARLCDVCAGQTLELPSRAAAAARARRSQILYDLARGLPASEVARRHGLSVRHIRNIRRDQERIHA
jgi:Mor family transcriptional regulator